MNSENKAKTWEKDGPSPNPGGRPKGFARRIRELTDDGNELIDIALKVARGELSILTPMGKDATLVAVLPSAREVMDAVKWLGDRGWGRVPESMPADDFSSLSDEELRAAAEAELGRGNAPSTGAVQ